MYHIRYIPDCPKCGKEMKGVSKNLPPFDDDHPFGSGVEGWWICPNCGFETDHFNHKPYDAISYVCNRDELFTYAEAEMMMD